jgi:MFS family permease
VVLRLPPDRRPRLFPWLVLLSGLALALSPLLDSVELIAAVWFVAGVGTALQLIANAAFVQAVPAHLRGRAFGVAGTSLMAVQGLVLLLAGGLADLFGPRNSVALIAVGGLFVLGLSGLLSRSPTTPAQVPAGARRGPAG